jgi:hypothetical protein
VWLPKRSDYVAGTQDATISPVMAVSKRIGRPESLSIRRGLGRLTEEDEGYVGYTHLSGTPAIGLPERGDARCFVS